MIALWEFRRDFLSFNCKIEDWMGFTPWTYIFLCVVIIDQIVSSVAATGAQCMEYLHNLEGPPF